MNTYDAIMKAADHIEANPDLWDFFKTRVPSDRGTPACALCWIGFFAGMEGKNYDDVRETLFGETYDIAWWRKLHPDYLDRYEGYRSKIPGQELAEYMRRYAEKYHGTEKIERLAKTDIPDSVLDIFKQKVSA